MRPDAFRARRHALTLEQLIVLSALAGMVALCWWWLIYSAQLMQSSPMDSAAMAGMAGMAADLPIIPYLASAFLMWSLMMVAMMAPSALPMILLYTRFSTRASPQRAILHSLVFAGCYLLIWIGFSAMAALIQTWFVRGDIVGRMALAFGSGKFAAFVLITAALYQLSPIKRACLAQCRSPLAFLMQRWSPTLAGAVRLGLVHGFYCLGCCWLLMLLLFVGGVMNLLWVALLTVIVIVEKLAPPALRIERWLAALMVIGAFALAIL